ncbi:hypothetical protein [Olsenella profusa]|uniref:Uncharacterized protein n=1 Tax=Olsenella profusa TaxID=138595 RepID=A0ABS2F2Q3_9ACTN|nr:hypothetical protein [Olsenella profusa]MBM6775090.1 hypothetical protein [Olsenella profusa]
MRKKERERLKDFQRGEDGHYVYAGDHVRLVGADRRRLLAVLWGSCGVALLASAVAGVANPGGLSGCPYVVMPYMCQLVALVSVVWGLGRLTVALRDAAGGRVRAYVRDETAGALPLRSAIAIGCALVAAVGEVVFLATGGTAVAPAEIALLACEVVVVVALVALRAAVRTAEWEGA